MCLSDTRLSCPGPSQVQRTGIRLEDLPYILMMPIQRQSSENHCGWDLFSSPGHMLGVSPQWSKYILLFSLPGEAHLWYSITFWNFLWCSNLTTTSLLYCLHWRWGDPKVGENRKTELSADSFAQRTPLSYAATISLWHPDCAGRGGSCWMPWEI